MRTNFSMAVRSFRWRSLQVIELADKKMDKPVIVQVDQWADVDLGKGYSQSQKIENKSIDCDTETEVDEKKCLRTNEQTEINVSPFIDMVFILLIFFIVATSFVNEIGISSTYKDSLPNSSTSLSQLLLT